MVNRKLSPATEKQKKKFAHYLAEGEEVILAFGIGQRFFWINMLSFLVLTLILALYPLFLHQLLSFDLSWVYFLPAGLVALVGFPFCIKLIHLKHKMAYIFTDRRVLVKDGVLSVKLTSAPYDKITHLTVKEDFFKRISYQIGDITIHTAGPTPVEIDLVKIQHPMKVKNLLEELIIKERSLLGTIEKSPLIRQF